MTGAASDPPDEPGAHHTAALAAAGVDRDAFSQAFQNLARDASMDKAALDAIAHAYVGGRTRWPNRAAALDAIESAFVERARTAAKRALIDKSRPW